LFNLSCHSRNLLAAQVTQENNKNETNQQVAVMSRFGCCHSNLAHLLVWTHKQTKKLEKKPHMFHSYGQGKLQHHFLPIASPRGGSGKQSAPFSWKGLRRRRETPFSSRRLVVRLLALFAHRREPLIGTPCCGRHTTPSRAAVPTQLPAGHSTSPLPTQPKLR